jgi:hypothetical protein
VGVLFQGSQKKKKVNSFETPERTTGVTTQLNLHWYENLEFLIAGLANMRASAT